MIFVNVNRHDFRGCNPLSVAERLHVLNTRCCRQKNNCRNDCSDRLQSCRAFTV